MDIIYKEIRDKRYKIRKEIWDKTNKTPEEQMLVECFNSLAEIEEKFHMLDIKLISKEDTLEYIETIIDEYMCLPIIREYKQNVVESVSKCKNEVGELLKIYHNKLSIMSIIIAYYQSKKENVRSQITNIILNCIKFELDAKTL